VPVKVKYFQIKPKVKNFFQKFQVVKVVTIVKNFVFGSQNPPSAMVCEFKSRLRHQIKRSAFFSWPFFDSVKALFTDHIPEVLKGNNLFMLGNGQ
jgi:hypothetical protein